MAATGTRNPIQDFVLTPQQQNLLFAALNSHKPSSNGSAITYPSSTANHSPVEAMSSLQGSPFLDYEYDLGGPDSSLDFSFDNLNGAKMIGDLPDGSIASKSESGDGDSPDKRSHPDDDGEEAGSAKRRESEDKVAKKPGRKPLTTEPSSKRKAQNRAAQRAFRERKEKHLKDLETKVQELEKASQSASQENGHLRAKIEKMTTELNEYKERVTILSNSHSAVQGRLGPAGQPLFDNVKDVNFRFEFPKFGVLPGPDSAAINSQPRTVSGSASNDQPVKRSTSAKLSPREQARDGTSPSNSSTYSQIAMNSQTREDLAQFSAGMFSLPATSNGSMRNGSRTSSESHYGTNGATSTNSPSASSNSNAGGPSSSCGTSPEPSGQTPPKPVETLTTIGEESSALEKSANGIAFPAYGATANANDFSWLSESDFQFDPKLFGEYREPQNNVLSSGFDDSFFNEAFDTVDFTTPYNLPVVGPGAPKPDNLIAQIDAAKVVDEAGGNANSSLMTCNKIWEELQGCPRVQSGDFDLDGLCSDLQKKAKCSGSGAVIDEADFRQAMKKYLGTSPDGSINCGTPQSKGN